eukprot:TRINITY_DN4996_c0_g1_i2.p1 TRINITY_DN4996_c0_g1~~TRINITY_DN4996_c0_g1_i2.p1  ORF type:complete len:458 (-),score=85.69 TRINITY_DN4996_c0_g1_i2:344-1717(-)
MILEISFTHSQTHLFSAYDSAVMFNARASATRDNTSCSLIGGTRFAGCSNSISNKFGSRTIPVLNLRGFKKKNSIYLMDESRDNTSGGFIVPKASSDSQDCREQNRNIDGGVNGSVSLNSSEVAEKSQWESIFPEYMQSRAEEGERDSEISNELNVVDRARAAAAAAAAASAKELECRVKSSHTIDGVASSVSAPPSSSAKPPSQGAKNLSELMYADPIWAAMRVEARLEAEKEPLLSSFLYASILAHPCFERALGFVLANRLQNPTLLATQLMDVFDDVFMNDADIQQSIRLDVQAVKDRDPSCRSYSWALLYLKVFAVDIHPAAQIGKGILLDHGTGVVIGETAVVGDRVSMLQGVTLGGTGKEIGDRHPKIGEGVLIGAGATILGNITVGKGAMVAAGSLVLKDIPSHSMVAGTPAKVVGFLEEQNPALTMQHDVTKGFCELVAEDYLHGGAGI